MCPGVAYESPRRVVRDSVGLEGRVEERKAFNNAFIGSEALCLALHREFKAFADKHRISKADAKLLCMNSETLVLRRGVEPMRFIAHSGRASK